MVLSCTVFTLIVTGIIFTENLQKRIIEQSLPSELSKLWIEFSTETYNHSFKQIDYFLPNRALFRTYKLLLETNQNFETSFECVGPSYNQSCLFKNLYYSDKTFWIFTTKRTIYPLPDVRIGAFIMTQYNPNWRRFGSYVDLDEFVRSRTTLMVIPNLTLYFDLPWLGNIGHALFDGLYPAYVALIRFPPKHLQPFRILLSAVSETKNQTWIQDIYNIFSGLGTLNIETLAEMSVGRWFAFQEVVMGSGHLCQRCLQPNLQLPGGVELNGSRLFRDRMYKQHGLVPPVARQNHSAERRNLQRPLRAYIIDNKRFTTQEKIEINAAITEINKYTDIYRNYSTENQTKLYWPLVHVSYISYPLITAHSDSSLPTTTKMMAHLQILQDMAIHISGPGTAQMYQTFLPDGSVSINLGGLRSVKQNTTLKNYTSFLEQYMASGTPYIRGLYYPINERRNGIKRDIIIMLIRKAAQLILDGFSIPVNPRDNLAPDGQLFTELCELDKEFCMTVTERSQKTNFICIDTWPEDIVHESGPWSIEGVIDENKKVTCSYNRTLLFELRKKYNIDFHI